MFATFRLGAYPMGWIEWLVAQMGNLLRDNMAENLKDHGGRSNRRSGA